MISTKNLLGRNGKKLADLTPVEPLTVEGEALAEQISNFLGLASAEQRSLTAESDELGRQMAELLAAKELGQPVDPESVISVSDRRQVVKQQLEAIEYKIAGLQMQQDALAETENERRRVALRPQLQQSATLGDALLEQFTLQMAAVSETIEAITRNQSHFTDLRRDWDRVSQHRENGVVQNRGCGVSEPRDVWGFFAPEVKRQATYSNPEARRTLVQQVDHTLYIEPAQRREQFLRDHARAAEEQERTKRERHNHYLKYLQTRRIAETNGVTDFPAYEFVIPGEMKRLTSDLDWSGER